MVVEPCETRTRDTLIKSLSVWRQKLLDILVPGVLNFSTPYHSSISYPSWDLLSCNKKGGGSYEYEGGYCFLHG